MLQAIFRAGHQRCNWLDLTRAEYFGYNDLDTVEALSSLQLGYDACFAEGSIDARSVDRFCRQLMSFDPFNPPSMTAWPEVFNAEAVS